MLFWPEEHGLIVKSASLVEPWEHAVPALRSSEPGGLVVPQFSRSPTPPRLRFDWSSWIVIAAIVVLLLAFGLYFYAG